MSQINGHISQIIGPVIDVYFDTKGQDAEKVLPKIHEALSIERPNGAQLIVEVQQHIGCRLNVPTGRSSLSRCSSTSARTRCVVLLWTIPMDCSVDWKQSRWAHPF